MLVGGWVGGVCVVGVYQVDWLFMLGFSCLWIGYFVFIVQYDVYGDFVGCGVDMMNGYGVYWWLFCGGQVGEVVQGQWLG